ncbi:TetR/AcrR family transcriptional regulator [Streptomyces sp. M19]
MDDLLRASGLGKGSLYGAFGDKRSLFLRVLRNYDDANLLTLRERLESAARGIDLVREFLLGPTNDPTGAVARRGCLLANSNAELATSTPDVAAEARRSYAAITTTLTEALERAQREGDLAPDADPPRPPARPSSPNSASSRSGAPAWTSTHSPRWPSPPWRGYCPPQRGSNNARPTRPSRPSQPAPSPETCTLKPHAVTLPTDRDPTDRAPARRPIVRQSGHRPGRPIPAAAVGAAAGRSRQGVRRAAPGRAGSALRPARPDRKTTPRNRASRHQRNIDRAVQIWIDYGPYSPQPGRRTAWPS